MALPSTLRRRGDVEYVVPVRWTAAQSSRDGSELLAYLGWVARWADVTVVDGSDPVVFDSHARLWGLLVRHVAPRPRRGVNGKVAGVVTGVELARHERVVIADDDVRYSAQALDQVVEALDDADLVRPQNTFTELPWHARWDTGRSLLNRCFGIDYPGTHGLRRSAFVAMGGYAGDVLFENLELARTVLAHGGVVKDLPGVYVGRRPPSAAHFWSQRVRQAYDSFAQPGRFALELGLAPTVVALAVRAPHLLAVPVTAVVLAAEWGRRRHGGTAAYGRWSALWAPAWVLERAVCSWLALATGALGGVRYGGQRVRRAASSQRALAAVAALAGPPRHDHDAARDHGR
jgi:hypothetical protein